MMINRLVWDDWNRNHITKHEVTPAEVKQVIDNEYVFLPSHSERIVVIGLAETGRALHIPLAARGVGIYYVVTARVADRKERAYYHMFKEEQEGQI